jgi:macrolide transport system ATP-binding/permease protein
MFTLWQDLRYGARLLLKNPGFTLIAVLTLALGIGANTAVLSTVNGYILRPLPVANPENVVRMYFGSRRDNAVWGFFSYPNYVDLRDQNRVFSGLAARQQYSSAISDSASGTGDDGVAAEAVWGEAVSGNYFDVLGVKAALGRTFLPEEDRMQGAHPVVVLAHALWQRRFNSDPSAIGKTTYLSGQPFTIIGVAPPVFQGVDAHVSISFWVPLLTQTRLGLTEDCMTKRGCRSLFLLGRTKPGMTMKQAEADLNLIAENLGRIYPDTNADTKISVVTDVQGRWGDDYGSYKFTSVIALIVAGLVLLVACVNVANLLLAGAGARSREIGIRLAIGAGRLRIVRQLLVESLLLAGLGGALGLLIAFWATDLIQAFLPPYFFPVNRDFSPDLFVLKWMLLVTLLTGVIFGLAPAMTAARTDLVSVLKGDATGPGKLQHSSAGSWNLRNLLVITQVAISITVLVCAGLFLRSLSRLQNVDPSFSAENLITMHIRPGLLGYSAAEGKRFFDELLRRIESRPGVRSASLVFNLPLGINSQQQRGPIFREGDSPPRGEVPFVANVIAPKYFETMRTPLVLGRDFTERDDEGAPRVAIVNQEFARRLYGNEQNALGKRFHQGAGTPPIEIVGVAKDGRYQNIYESLRPCFFLPKDQEGYHTRMMLLVSASASTELKAVIEGVRREIARIDSRVPAFGLQIGEQNLASAFWAARLAAGLGTAFGLLVLVLATMGLYSVMTYAVSRRTREIGIRIALGAQGRDVLKMVIRQGLILVIVGMVIGLAGALALTRIVSSLLFGISASDPLSFVGVAALLALVALLACWVPAWRATRVDPMIALRCE